MRRRLMLEQDEYIATFDDLYNEAVSIGCPTGEDEYGRYFQANGNIVSNKDFLIKNYKQNTSYDIYIRGNNSVYANASNLGCMYNDGTYPGLILRMEGRIITTDNTKTLVCIHGYWYGGIPKIYDFWIKEHKQ